MGQIKVEKNAGGIEGLCVIEPKVFGDSRGYFVETYNKQDMVAKGYLQKLTSPDDGRVTYISITEKGERLSRKYDQDYFSSLAPYLSEISEEEADNMIRTIGKFYQIMCDRREHYDK